MTSHFPCAARWFALAVLVAPAACSTPPARIDFATIGPLVGAAGRGSFRFGVATAATQIEDANPNTDWHLFTLPASRGGLGQGSEFVGDASGGFSRALNDVALIKALGVDSYRFSIEWARVEPRRNQIDEAALQHYSDLIDALRAAGVRPMITIHHFSNPVWIADPRAPDCPNGPSDENLCGLGHPVGGPLVVQEMAKFARLLATRFGDRVDEWATLNEPVNYLAAAYGVGAFPPGRRTLLSSPAAFAAVVRDYLSAHVAMYHAIKEADRIDADGDGEAASVGMTLLVADWVPARGNQISHDPVDVAAAERVRYFFHYFIPDALRTGQFDTDFDGTPDRSIPEWAGTLDWLGVQYYFRAGVSGANPLLSAIGATPCVGGLDFGACVPALDPTHCVPTMGYEYSPEGLLDVLRGFAARYPDLPLLVTESGIATTVGERRAENVVRALEQIGRARAAGVDLRGYYHWSLYDNFEWQEGFKPRFGLYYVDYTTFARTPTRGAELLTDIAGARALTSAQRKRYGGTGGMTPEAPGADAAGYCR
jgi:beta-glucosidase